jgi:hypothetical protein
MLVTKLAGKAVTLYRCIWEVVALNFDRETVLTRMFRNSPLSFQNNGGSLPRLHQNCIFSNTFQFVILVYSTLCSQAKPRNYLSVSGPRLNPVPPEYDTGVSPIRLRRAVMAALNTGPSRIS